MERLPRLKLIKHDGKVESFRVFWIHFKDVMESYEALKDDDGAKHRYLLSYAADADIPVIATKNWTQAGEYLTKKYTSATAIRVYLMEKMRRLEMKDEEDLLGLKELKEAAFLTFLIAS